MTLPIPKVEIAFSTQPNDPSPAWVDVTSFVKALDGISISRGRQDEYDTVQPSRVSLTLLNRDGRFTPGYVGSPYYPNVKKGRKIRISVTWAGVTYRRFTGYVDEWPVSWADASATVANVQISATSRMSLLGRQAALPSIVSVEYLKDSPVAYYPLGDGAGSLNAGNVASTVQQSLAVTPFGGGSTANIVFGSAASVPTDSITGAQYTRVSATAGAYLTAPITGIASASAVSAEAWIQASSTQEMGILQLDYGLSYLVMGTTAAGKLTATLSSSTIGTYTATSSATVTDGLLHHVVVEVPNSGGLQLSVDGTGDGSAVPPITQYTYTRMIIGGGVLNSAFAGTISHVAVYVNVNGINELLHYQAGSTGFSGERSDQRISRLAAYAGVPSFEISTETGLSTSVMSQDTTGQIPLQLMQDITSTEGGVLFDAGDGTLTFHARSHRYNAASELTVMVPGDLNDSFQPKLDDQNLANDVSASRQGGVSLRIVDSASVSEYGTYKVDIQLLTTSDNEVADAASWRVYTSSTPYVKVPTAEVDVARSLQKANILAREIGDRITISNLPDQAPASSMDFFIEGWTETITANTHTISFTLSNASQSGVWQLDSTTYSVLGTSTRLAY